MQEVLSDELVFRRANGSVTSKADYLQGLMNTENTYDRLDADDIEVQTYEGMAVVSLCVNAAGMRGVSPFAGKFRNVRIFMQDSTAPHGWLCHMWFNTKIGD